VRVPDSDASARFAEATRAAEADGSQHPHERLQVITGDFRAVARATAGGADAVLTCFFIDACGDPAGAIEAVGAQLAPGGVWVNCGPLEYEGTAGAHAIGGRKLRLCANEVLLLLARRGFEVLESRVGEECQYTQDPASMLQHVFGCLYFVARKLPEGTPD